MYTEEMTDRIANLLISSNVHYVHIVGDNEKRTTVETLTK